MYKYNKVLYSTSYNVMIFDQLYKFNYVLYFMSLECSAHLSVFFCDNNILIYIHMPHIFYNMSNSSYITQASLKHDSLMDES